jgi:hypothetical protein
MRIQDEVQFIYKPEVLKKIGLRFIRTIKERTAKGIDQDGNEFKDYSRRTFGIPAGALTKTARKLLQKNGLMQWYRKGTSRWILIKGGYWNLKMARYAKTSYDGTVNLMATGAMLRRLRVQKSDGNEITIGFASNEDAEKAYYNKQMGREFLGISPEDWRDPEIEQLIASGIIVK